MLNILVTGGSGFIASHLVTKLIKNENNFVINLDKLDYCSNDNTKNIEGRYKFINGNICNKELVLFILNEYNIKVIYHLAAQTHVDNSFFNSTLFTMDNVIGTHNLLECCREYDKLDKFIHMSTDEVYGEVKENEIEKDEKSLLKPTNPYAASKAGAEMLVESYNKSFNLPTIIVRCNNVYGPNQYPEKVIPAFIFNILSGVKCQIQGDGNNKRHFIFVDDVIDALELIYNEGKVSEIYNIASKNDEIKIIDLAKLLINKILGDKIDLENCNYDDYINYVEDRKFNDFRYLINSDKLELLGWKSNVKFEDGLEKTIEHFKKILYA